MFRLHLVLPLFLGLSLLPAPGYAQEATEDNQESAETSQEPVRLEKPPVLLEQLPVSLPKNTVFPAKQVPVVLNLLVSEEGVVTEAPVVEAAGSRLISSHSGRSQVQFEPF